jgi:hypothetical protein
MTTFHKENGLVEQQLPHLWIHKDNEYIMCTCENDYLMVHTMSFLSRSNLFDAEAKMYGRKTY